MVVDDAYNLDNFIFAVFITFVDLVRWRKSKSVGCEESANKQNCFGKTRNEWEESLPTSSSLFSPSSRLRSARLVFNHFQEVGRHQSRECDSASGTKIWLQSLESDRRD